MNRRFFYQIFGGMVVAMVLAAIGVLVSRWLFHISLQASAMALALGIVVSVLLAVAYLVARYLASPIEWLSAQTKRYSQGKLSHKMVLPGEGEVSQLAGAITDIVAQLSERIQVLSAERNEKDAILSAMAEGIITFDAEEQITSANRAAVALLDLPEALVGRHIQEVLRYSEVGAMSRQVLKSKASVERLIFDPRSERHIQTYAVSLTDGAGRVCGGLLVFHDVTRLQKYDAMRREFVENVSHELKTPITLILGFLDTLISTEDLDPASRYDFLSVARSHALRMNAIVNDLLQLAIIEQGERLGDIALVDGSVSTAVEKAVGFCTPRAVEKRVMLTLSGERDLRAQLNAPLLEQALINLIDNAIKYSPEASAVTIHIQKEAAGVTLSVTDQGEGISTADQARIFERFYRTDKARSRALGGTGLGLAIVKHIAAIHHGQIKVHSEPKKGSTFTLYLPSQPVIGGHR